jgi:cytochrome b6-f complex iron-sulfur subunit/menaquinol-cytochrome c reductase iron-sulfur subunit
VSDQTHDERNGRRCALKVLIGAGSVAFGGALGAPAVVFVAAPVRAAGEGGGAHWVRTVRLDTLEDGLPRKVSIVSDEHDAWSVARDVELGAVWLVRRGDSVAALSVTCPHLGCAIDRSPDGSGFQCPCHTSAFSVDGKRVSGPAPRDMDPLSLRTVDGFVEVDFRKFRIGVAERSEMG